MSVATRSVVAIAFALVLLAAACTQETESSDGDGTTADTSAAGSAAEGAIADGPAPLFSQGCPVADQSVARVLDDSTEPLAGPRAVGRPGDLLLANERAAFVITAPVTEGSPQRTWYHYGGVLVDAAAVDGCEQTTPDQLDEIGIVVGRLNLNDFGNSVLRAFRADTIEVINDGSDGEAAVVRATGTDDFLQLIEYELISAVAAAGGSKPVSEPFGLRVEVDYVLDPDDPVLQMTTRIVATEPGPRSLIGAALVTWGDDVGPLGRPESVIEVSGFGLDVGIPWQVAQGDEGSYAFAIQNASQAVATISGVNAFLDINQAFDAPLVVDEVDSSAEMTYLFSVGTTDANSAVQGLLAHDPQLGPGTQRTRPVSGTVVDEGGSPVADARIEVEMRRDDGEWRAYDVIAGADDGRFEADVVVLADADGVDPEVRLRVITAGRADLTVPVPLAPDGDESTLVDENIVVGPAGSLNVDATDTDGAELPVRITLYQGDEEVLSIDSRGETTEAVAPGTYDAVVSRGFEYDRVETEIVVPDNGSFDLAAQLTRVVDTDGWISVDTHVHTEASPDSTFDSELRMLDAAATGLEIVVNTDHEIIIDVSSAVDDAGLTDWVASFPGEEVTASSPEHTTIYGVEPDGTERGGNPLWYGLDLGEIYALEAERGAAIRGLNHPSEYLRLIEWDPVTATPANTDARTLGLGPDQSVWSWDFEQFELQNGDQPVLGSDSDDKGLFDFWQSAINTGRRITAVAATDAHGPNAGAVRTFVRVESDDPSTITVEELADAIAAGRAVLSTGAFGEVTIDGAGPGDTASVAAGQVDVALKVQAAPGIDISSIRVFANCDQVLDIAVDPSDDPVRFDDVVQLDLPADANITVLGFGSEPMPRPFADSDPERVPRFTTNPVFVDVDGNGEFDPPGDKGCDYPRG